MEFLRRLFGSRVAEEGPQWDADAGWEDIVCLALSRKHGGRCFAGLRVSDGRWVRPVSSAPDGTLYPAHFIFDDGQIPELLKVVRVPLKAPLPAPHQPENWLIGESIWRRSEDLEPDLLLSLLDGAVEKQPLLFGTAGDRVPMADLLGHPPEASLALVRPRYPLLISARGYDGRRQARLRFLHGRAWYRLALTDPAWEARIWDLPEGEYGVDRFGLDPLRLLATVSLGEPFEGNCYKLVAALFERPL